MRNAEAAQTLPHSPEPPLLVCCPQIRLPPIMNNEDVTLPALPEFPVPRIPLFPVSCHFFLACPARFRENTFQTNTLDEAATNWLEPDKGRTDVVRPK
jgi:hypothetical protein